MNILGHALCIFILRCFDPFPCKTDCNLSYCVSLGNVQRSSNWPIWLYIFLGFVLFFLIPISFFHPCHPRWVIITAKINLLIYYVCDGHLYVGRNFICLSWWYLSKVTPNHPIPLFWPQPISQKPEIVSSCSSIPTIICCYLYYLTP